MCSVWGDETWTHHKERQEYAVEASVICFQEIKIQPSARKLMLTDFWEAQGPILEH
jgi:hypothetical protein